VCNWLYGFYRVVDGIEDNRHAFNFNVEDKTAKTVTPLGSKTLDGKDILILVSKLHMDHLGHCFIVLFQDLVR